MKRMISVLGMVLLIMLSSACSQLDVVGKESKTSFNAVLNAMPAQIKADEMNAGWSLSAPDGTVRFIWSEDYSRSPLHDVMLEIEARPFIDAGLDTNRLPGDIAFYDGKLMVGTKLGDNKLKYSGSATPFASYEQIVNLYRRSIGYHAAMDHYGVSIGDGNLFEWAKDMGTNDKDIVFVLNPEPFIKAGVNPGSVKGWVFDKVPVDVDGKPAQVDKFLKPFNLR
ncbi:hypothetical protein [Leadbettera azotonutricia]|uniref:Putative lipoprotein n=1 Tax=Leadbettera azotonutricia (strain ATCC BAA-888 / DSM 13862 / ZAS-9) TaxID=545695 RepID=F5Y9G4_LEAAZ|nr:hypothetical protein [Leadbettera azotonutricia]AEF81736.1 putative lipoprotein [Leadbettera azotonutricia ZAS-9]